MKRKLFSFGCCLVMLLTALFTSCKQEVPVPEMVTISYVSEYGTLAKTEKIVDKGYKLKADDLPTLRQEGFTFDKWYINKEEAKADTVINKDTVLVAKWTKVLDKTAPKEVTGLKAENLNGTIALTWVDPSDTDLFGIEVSYKVKVETVARAIVPIESNSIMVAPGDKHAEISKLTSGTAYIFTVKAVDLAGNKSSGVTIECTPVIKTGTPMEITLTQDVDTPTNQPVTITVGIQTAGNINAVKYAEGDQKVEYFANDGTNVTLQDNAYKFSVPKSAIYTVFAQDVEGRREVKTIEITNIDLIKPNSVSKLNATYSDVTGVGKITITWEEPQDSDFAEVVLRYSDGTDIASVKKGTTQYQIENIAEDNTEYTICAYSKDNAGNEGEPLTKKVNAVSPGKVGFSSITLPRIGTAIKVKTIDAIVKGSNYEKATVPTSDYKLSCSENEELVQNASITIIDNETMKVTLNIPNGGITAGTYNVTIGCGTFSTSGKLIVNDSSQYKVGDILLSDGSNVPYDTYKTTEGKTPVAVVCGLSKYGLHLGLGLKQSDTELAWAPSSSTGYNTNFEQIVCTPSDKGSGTADTATFEGDLDGSDNWSVICNVDKEGTKNAATNYPAFNWVSTYGTTYNLPDGYKDGWYMPSIAELTEIYRNKTVINAALTKLGTEIASPLKEEQYDWYWSSSQYSSNYRYAWVLDFSRGGLGSYDKGYDGSVCCVRAF